MTLILASRPNVYSSSPLDRIATRREDADWIEQRLTDPDTLFVPVWRNRNLVRGMESGAPEAVYISGEAAHALRMQGGPWAFLGMLEDRAVFAVDISPPTTRCRCCRRNWGSSSICAPSAGACRSRKPRCWRMPAA